MSFDPSLPTDPGMEPPDPSQEAVQALFAGRPTDQVDYNVRITDEERLKL